MHAELPPGKTVEVIQELLDQKLSDAVNRLFSTSVKDVSFVAWAHGAREYQLICRFFGFLSIQSIRKWYHK
jgi:hypothetical protein